MVIVYYLTGNAIDKKQTFKSWEDAYIFITDFANTNNYQILPDGAIKKETNQLLKIFR
jgi:hypothetical protein